MIFSTSIVRKHVEDGEILYHTSPDKLLAPDHFEFAHCDQCKLVGPAGKSQSSAVGLALAEGWCFKIAPGFHLMGLFSADDLLGGGSELFCVRCSQEFEN